MKGLSNTILQRFFLASLLVFFCIGSACAQQNLLPLPQSANWKGANAAFNKASVEMPAWQDKWSEWLTSQGVAIEPSAPMKIKGEIVDSIPGANGSDEAYSINIAPKAITVKASSPKGIYWALMTLEQLAEKKGAKLSVPQGQITDWPAFPFRAFMMDAGRSFISVPEIKKEMELMSKFKMNVYHLHLTENQAWRLESKIFPMLNDSVNMTRQPGLYYSVEDAKDLMRYAADHNILLIPEIDVPGHSAAFVRTFRHDMQSPEGSKIAKLLIEEACEIFDSVPYLHIGTDEVKFTNPDFVPEVVELVKSKGKEAISWNPGWNYQPGEIAMTNMWSYRGKPTPGIPATDSRFHYINHFDVFSDIVALYRSNVYGKDKCDGQIIGSILALWNDRYIDDEESIIAQNSVYPTILALAERTWMGGGDGYFDTIGCNLPSPDSLDFQRFADFERRLLWHKDNTLKDVPVPYVKQTQARWRITDAFPNDGDFSKTFPPETTEPQESYEYEGKTYGTAPAAGSGIYLRHVWGPTVPAFYSDPQPNHTAYAYTYVYSPKDQTVGLLAEFQNYSRSESDLPPAQGEWDRKGSKIWINNKEILPPTWTSTHTERTNEITLGNENFTAREPIPVELHKGWNKVLLKLPTGAFNTQPVRLSKWMFSVAFVTPDGRHAAPGLIYSPEKKL